MSLGSYSSPIPIPLVRHAKRGARARTERGEWDVDETRPRNREFREVGVTVLVTLSCPVPLPVVQPLLRSHPPSVANVNPREPKEERRQEEPMWEGSEGDGRCSVRRRARIRHAQLPRHAAYS